MNIALPRAVRATSAAVIVKMRSLAVALLSSCLMVSEWAVLEL